MAQFGEKVWFRKIGEDGVSSFASRMTQGTIVGHLFFGVACGMKESVGDSASRNEKINREDSPQRAGQHEKISEKFKCDFGSLGKQHTRRATCGTETSTFMCVCAKAQSQCLSNDGAS